MAKTPPRKVVSDGKALKALAHPLRQRMLAELGSLGEANSTTIAKALDENTGTTSYHLRVLAEAGIIEEVKERATGRERWYRTVPTDRRAPAYDSLSPEDKAAYDAWARLRIPGELRLVQRMVEEYNKHGRWLNLSRSQAYYTLEDLEALFEDYIALLHKYGRSPEDAPSDARPMHLRFFHLPVEEAAE
ncbi:helix-turn-helix transcriptional regulator [Amycolatopsis rhizosphaerae]|uniref:Helix-turn-helix transcriptional regulator n=1 Tax=Amycolatopsis rhizosphaerae TaxID=2053003 RepID=A0A558CXQ3_9PSEU|nr:helix-turn-helix domain-containing protein [Amycolatopsis rhizosphaerae]TVT53500.1 helix-turn-helix transcriptional regulator [Amycolatopsis rhizosphaerae]